MMRAKRAHNILVSSYQLNIYINCLKYKDKSLVAIFTKKKYKYFFNYETLNVRLLKLANAKGKISIDRKLYLSSASKSKASDASKTIYDSIENYKRINALTVFLKDDDTTKFGDELKTNKEKIKSEPDKSRTTSNTKKSLIFIKQSDKLSNLKRSQKFEEVIRAYTATSTYSLGRSKQRSKNQSADSTLQDRGNKHDSKLSSEKMASGEATPAVKPICSKDHKAREKASTEKYVQKLKRSTKRIPATQKYMYTFGEVASDIIDYKEKRDNYTGGTICSNLGIKRSLSTEQNKSKKTNSDFLKRQESSATSKSSEWLDIEKQLKSVRSQKKEINQLITKELREAKISWQEMTGNKSLASVRNRLNRSQDPHVEKLCESLEKSTQEVEHLYRSFTGLDSLKNGQSNKNIERTVQYDKAMFAYERGDNNEITSLKNYAEIMDTSYTDDKTSKEFTGNVDGVIKKPIFRMTSENDARNAWSNVSEMHNGPIKSMYSDIESAADKFSNLNISTNSWTNAKKINNETIECNEDNKNRQVLRTDSFTNTFIKQNCDISSQIGTSVSAGITTKSTIHNYTFPQLYKSEYLRKSCGLN